MDTVLAVRAYRRIGSEAVAARDEGLTIIHRHAKSASRAPGDLWTFDVGVTAARCVTIIEGPFHFTHTLIAGAQIFEAEWRR